MGLFNKIKELFRRSRTPKLPEGKENLENENQNKYEDIYSVTLPNNEKIMIKSIRSIEDKIRHRNGEITNIILASVYEGSTIGLNNDNTIAFEISEGASIDDIILQKIGQYYMYERNMPDNNKECMYLGKISQDPYDLSTKNKSNAVEKYINEKVAPQVSREKQELIERQNESWRQRTERTNTKQNEFVSKMQEEYKEYVQKQNQIKSQRIENPFLNQFGDKYVEEDGKNYFDYNGVNLTNGDILKLRKMNKVGKDENGTYIYTGYINTTSEIYDEEVALKDVKTSGMPVCFATDKKIEDIIQSNNAEDIRSLLSLLSEAQNSNENNGYLNYVGSIDKYNKTDKNIMNTSKTIQSAVTRLQQKFYQEKIQEQEQQQGQEI